eukprot:CFRG4214T1
MGTAHSKARSARISAKVSAKTLVRALSGEKRKESTATQVAQRMRIDLGVFTAVGAKKSNSILNTPAETYSMHDNIDEGGVEDKFMNKMDAVASVAKQIQEAHKKYIEMANLYVQLGVDLSLFAKTEFLLQMYNEYWNETDWANLIRECGGGVRDKTVLLLFDISDQLYKLRSVYQYEIEYCMRVLNPTASSGPHRNGASVFDMVESDADMTEFCSSTTEENTDARSVFSMCTEEEVAHTEFYLEELYKALVAVHFDLTPAQLYSNKPDITIYMEDNRFDKEVVMVQYENKTARS